MEYVGKIIYNNVSRKKDDSKNLTVEDLVGHEIVKETEKAVAIEWCEDAAGYHMVIIWLSYGWKRLCWKLSPNSEMDPKKRHQDRLWRQNANSLLGNLTINPPSENGGGFLMS